MIAVKLVCPNNRALMDRLERRTLCVRVDSPQEIVAAADNARGRNTLSCVICDAKVPLDAIDVDEKWQDIPIALQVPSVGKFRNLSGKLGLLRKLNLRVYLPYARENLTGARLLASVGIPVGIVLEAETPPDWEALADLMTYALLGIAPHAPVEPFQTIADSYRPAARSEDWGRAYFDDPSRYLHVDAAGNIALSRRELLAGDFVAEPSALDSPEVAEAVDDRGQLWRELFLANHFCATCRAWRVCRGRFSAGRDAPDGCTGFFGEMADVAEQYRNRSRPNGRVETWRP